MPRVRAQERKMTDLYAKIRAMIAKAESTEYEVEADAFMAKVDELMREHQLSMKDIEHLPDQRAVNARRMNANRGKKLWLVRQRDMMERL
jgi:predicted phage gp36 major capsid-like protein